MQVLEKALKQLHSTMIWPELSFEISQTVINKMMLQDKDEFMKLIIEENQNPSHFINVLELELEEKFLTPKHVDIVSYMIEKGLKSLVLSFFPYLNFIKR